MTNAADAKIAFVGGGNMAHALATRLAASRAGPVVVAEPQASQRARFAPPVATTANNREAVQGAAVAVLAVKPQIVETAAREIAPVLGDALVVSIAAGVPLAAIERWLGGNRAVVRCMPNTPALVGAGISGLVANAATTNAQRNEAEAVLSAAGEDALVPLRCRLGCGHRALRQRASLLLLHDRGARSRRAALGSCARCVSPPSGGHGWRRRGDGCGRRSERVAATGDFSRWNNRAGALYTCRTVVSRSARSGRARRVRAVAGAGEGVWRA